MSATYTTVRTKTTETKTFSYSGTSGLPYGFDSGSRAENYSVVTTLSEEIPLSEVLLSGICNEDAFCDPETDPGCEPCCTGEGAPGRLWESTPYGCITPGSSGTAWDATDCDTSATMSGQSSTLSLWFKDLVPGTTYKVTITYKRCEFAKDEADNYLTPTCSAGVPCVEGVENTTLTDEVTFEATDWAELLSDRCGQCDIEYQRCVLQDEADAWNTANPEETPRTVACGSPGFDVPAIANHYTWFDSCLIEVVTP